ncbi:MAG TPA: SdiA-regulated domain-containing protein [Kribbellaceae bacterium]|nr:SdiA-regulated domain-containing protein [Kribbellaceae bacterium]
MIRRLLAGAAALAFAVPVLGLAPAHADEGEGKKLFTIDDERITESSGLARSHKHKDIWWTINDSGDSARLFALDTEGKVVAELTYSAEVHDVEAIAVGTDDKIYVADIGDNVRDRKQVHVYVIREPEDLQDQKVKYRQYDFAYPDGPHNAEALLVEPQTNRMFIVTKEVPKSTIWSLPPKQELSRSDVNKLVKIADAPAIVTDGTFTPDGKRMILRDPVTMFVVGWPGAKPRFTAQLPLQPTGESLAMGPDDTSVLVGSEGKTSAVYQVAIPTKQATPAKPKTQDAGTNAAGAKQSHTMRWTLIGAGGFALLMAMFTFPQGRRERADAAWELQRRPHHRTRSVT